MTKTDKTLKTLIINFNTKNPDFSSLIPYVTGELEVNLEDFKGELIGKWNAIKTLWELSRPKKPVSRSRVWTSSDGYIHLVSWSNASLLRVMGTKWFYHFKSEILQHPSRPVVAIPRREDVDLGSGERTTGVKSSNPAMGYKLLDRLEGQFLDELRSVVANIEEGFVRPTTSSYLDFIGYSQGSLKEAKGEVQRLRQDGFLPSVQGSVLSDLGINLKDWHEALKKSVISQPIKESKGSYRTLKEFKFNYPSVDNLDPSRLTYELLIELINKTDWNLRKLVESLEKKLDDEKMFYKVEQARIRDRSKAKS